MTTPFPGGARFAFTVIDDTDVSTLENVRPLYALLHRLGLLTTKTVWTHNCDDASSDFRDSDTLEDPAYRAWVLELQQQGFEVTWHCPTMESSTRPVIEEGLFRLREICGVAPRVHANHSYNRENLYWGEDRLDDPILKALYRRTNGVPPDHYQGHVEGSPFWWGDLAQREVDYSRNLTFSDLNVLNTNPTLPYRDPARPLVPWWFSAADGEDRAAFNALVNEEAQDRLEAEGGVAIVATHFGKGFVDGGRVHPETERLLTRLASRPGWFVPVGPLLDWLREHRSPGQIPGGEWRRMQWRWAQGLVRSRLASRFGTGGRR